MTGSLRSTARSPLGAALMGLLILVFLILGVGGGGRFPDAFGVTSADSVITAGSHVVSTGEFKRIFEAQKQKLEEQNKQPLTTEFLVQNNVDEQLLGQLALDNAFSETLLRAGVAPGKTLLDSQIQKLLPAAFDKVTGKFDEKLFMQKLAEQGLTPAQVRTQLTDELAQRHYGTAMEAGLRLPRIFAAPTAVGALENRDVSYFIYDARKIAQPAAPSDAQLTAYMQDHAAQLKRPELRVITLVRFSAQALAPGVKIDPAAVQKEFDFRKDSLSIPEKRTLIEIPVKTADEGAKAAARLAAGEDPSAIAKSLGVDPIPYANAPQTAIADRKVAAAAFAMTAGQARGPIQGDLGIAAVKVFTVTPGTAASLAAATPKIEADLRQKAARDQAYKQSQAFDDALQAGSPLAQAAQKAGAQVVTLGPIDATGAGADHKPNPLLADKILKAAFAQGLGDEPELADAGAGEYFALHVDKVIPPALPALAEIRPQLVQAYMTETFMKALRGKVDGMVGQIKAGQSLETVAAAAGGHVTHLQGLQRLKAAQYQAMGKEFLQAVFAAKPGEGFAAGAPGGVYVAKLDAVRSGDPTTTAKVLDVVRARLGQDYLRDLYTASETAAHDAMKVTTNLTLARQALGVDPNAVKPGAKSPAPAP